MEYGNDCYIYIVFVCGVFGFECVVGCDGWY